MRDAIVEIVRESNGGLAARLLRASVNYEGMTDLVALDLRSDQLPRLDTSFNVQTYGASLQAALSKHAAIRDELRQMFSTMPPHLSRLRFLIDRNAEWLRCETLFDPPPAGYLALKDVCVVSRIADSGTANGVGVRTFSYPLRLVAFLSPAGYSAADEFSAICDQVTAARAKGLNIECQAYLGEQDLLDDAARRIAANELDGITALPMPSDSFAIEEVLREAQPQFLHFFCHGTESSGVPALELATINDRETQELKPNNPKTGSIKLSTQRITGLLGLCGKTWVTVLNSCSGAMPVQNLYSMALDIAKHGASCSVGMAEPITSADATAFSNVFYKTLFGLVQTGLAAQVGSTVTLDLAPAVVPVRRKFHDLYADQPPDAFGRWCLPVLYQRSDPLSVLVPTPGQVMDPETKVRIGIVADLLKNLPAETPDGYRDMLLKTLDQAPRVPEALRPGRSGIVSAP